MTARIPSAIVLIALLLAPHSVFSHTLLVVEGILNSDITIVDHLFLHFPLMTAIGSPQPCMNNGIATQSVI